MMMHLDGEMHRWSTKLRDDLGISLADSGALATRIAEEVKSISPENRAALVNSSPVPLERRIEELVAFQRWMDFANKPSAPSPAMVRAQVITQNYICFVYLPEVWFRGLKKFMASHSATGKVARFLTDNPVRAFRNALAHGNWQYKEDFGGLVFWARKGDRPDEPLIRFEVTDLQLAFWQALARCTAYASLLACQEPASNFPLSSSS